LCSSATHVLTIRHRNRPGVLAHVFGVLAGAEINVEEVENIIYHGAQATLARIHLDGHPDPTALAQIRDGNPDIISVDLSAIDGRGQRNGGDQATGAAAPKQQKHAAEKRG
jgi:D-3-phosphoglycerate dehydrogenase / 2-oxoglutarate reductase